MIVVAFDLDDTLIPEILFIKSGIRYIASYISEKFPCIPQMRIVGAMDTAMLTRRNHYAALETLLSDYGIADAIDMKQIVAEFRAHRPDASIYHLAPSMENMLLDLKNKGIKTSLITDGRSITQRNKIEAAALYRFFDSSDIFISEETGYDKLSPSSFLQVMKKNADAKEYHYVGDNPKKDFLHPSKLGWKTHLAHPFPLAIHQGLPG